MDVSFPAVMVEDGARSTWQDGVGKVRGSVPDDLSLDRNGPGTEGRADPIQSVG